MLAVDFRHPAVLAKELASLDLFSGGRLQVGLGAATIWTSKAADIATAHVAVCALSLMTGAMLAVDGGLIRSVV